MPQYIALIDWTDQGVRDFKDTVDRYEAAENAFKELGVTFTNIWWTLGAHDMVATVEAPDDDTLAAALLAVAGRATYGARRSGRSLARKCARSSARFPEPTPPSSPRASVSKLRQPHRAHDGRLAVASRHDERCQRASADDRRQA